jgi:dihydrofolate reductase
LVRLIYSAISSLDGFIEDADGGFNWAAPDDEVHAFINDLERAVGTYLFGRRMYETLMVWETDPALVAGSPISRDYAAIWAAADKIVFSRMLEKVSTHRTRLERDFDPQVVRQLKSAASQDISIGGPTLAAHAFRSGLIDECHLFIAPVIVGGGKPSLPADMRVDLSLLDQRRFAGGMLFLRYRISP